MLLSGTFKLSCEQHNYLFSCCPFNEGRKQTRAWPVSLSASKQRQKKNPSKQEVWGEGMKENTV